VVWLTNQVAFTAGNPRVEHITGVVHLYRDVPADSVVAAQPSGSDAAAPAAQACHRAAQHGSCISHPYKPPLVLPHLASAAGCGQPATRCNDRVARFITSI